MPTFLQIKNIENLPEQVKIMQYQGEDEFKLSSRNRLVSDQPYFG